MQVMRGFGTWPIRFLLLLVMAAGAGSCTRNVEDYKTNDPEGRQCIPITRAIQIPPQHCPLALKCTSETGCNQDETGTPYTGVAPAPVANGDAVYSDDEFVPDMDNSVTPPVQRKNKNGQLMYNYGPACKHLSTFKYTVPALNTPVTLTTGPVQWLKSQVQAFFQPASQGMFEAIAQNPGFRKITIALVTMVIVLYSIGIILQIRRANLYDLLMMTLKICTVLAFALNWDVFSAIIFNSLEDQGVAGDPGFKKGTITVLSEQATCAGKMSANPNTGGDPNIECPASGVQTPFSQMDDIIAMMFSWNFQKLLLALLWSDWVGWLYCLMLIYMVMTYLWMAAAVMQAFLVALIGRFMLYAVAPIFIMLALLDQTRQLFKNWMELLLSFSLQPVFLGAFLGLFLGILTTLMGSIAGSNPTGARLICYDAYGWLKNTFKFFHMFQFADIHGQTVGNDGVDNRIPLNLYVITTVTILSFIMRGMMKWVVDLATVMTKGFVSTAGTYIAGYETLGNTVAAVPAAATGAIRGAIFGNRTAHGWEGGLVRGSPFSGAYRGAKRAGVGQLDKAKESMKKEFGSGGL